VRATALRIRVCPKAKRIDSELESLPKAKAAFIEPMLLLRTGALPEAAEWLYELLCGGPHNNSSVALNVMWRSEPKGMMGSR
jgi:hypothetical protein